MFGLRRAGVLGASAALFGGVAYFLWTYATSSGKEKPKTRPGEAGEGRGEEEEEIREEEAPVIGAQRQQTQPEAAAAAEAPNSSQVKSQVCRTHLRREG